MRGLFLAQLISFDASFIVVSLRVSRQAAALLWWSSAMVDVVTIGVLRFALDHYCCQWLLMKLGGWLIIDVDVDRCFEVVSWRGSADGCGSLHGLGYFAIGAGFLVWTVLSVKDLLRLMFDVTYFSQIGTAVVCACLRGFCCRYVAHGFTRGCSRAEYRAVIDL